MYVEKNARVPAAWCEQARASKALKKRKNRLLKTKRREKYAVWIDNDDLDRLREYQQKVGVPVSESIRRAIKTYLQMLPSRQHT